MGTLTALQLQHHEKLDDFFLSRQAHQVKPTQWYWPVIAAANGLFDRFNASLTFLQSRNLLMAEQENEIGRFLDSLILPMMKSYRILYQKSL